MDNKIIKDLLVRSVEGVFQKAMISAVVTNGSSELLFNGKEYYTATIGFTGHWNGLLCFQCKETLAFQAVSTLLKTDITKLGQKQVQSGLGEIVRRIGEKFESSFSGLDNATKEPFHMSVPSVILGRNSHVLASRMDSAIEILLITQGELLVVKFILKEGKRNRGSNECNRLN